MPIFTTLLDYRDKGDSSKQGTFIKSLGITDPPAGICLNISLVWLLECIETGTSNPADVWQEMKAQGKYYLKQIARNHMATYDKSKTGLGVSGLFDKHVDTVLRLLSKGAHCTFIGSGASAMASTAHTTFEANIPSFTKRLDVALAESSTSPPCASIVFHTGSGKTAAAHAIAAVLIQGVKSKDALDSTAGDSLYIYDPNFGVFIVPYNFGGAPTTMLRHFTMDIMNAYSMGKGYVLPIL